MALLAGLALRFVVLARGLAHLNSDEAVIYLMARHASEGHFQAFYWGQYYGGSALPSLLGLIFFVVGAHAWLLPFFEIVVATLTSVLPRYIGTEIWDRRTGNLSASLMWLSPLWVYYAGHDVIYMDFGFVFALGAAAFALRYRRTGALRLLVLAGVAAGLGWWVTPMTVLVTWPLGLLVLRRSWRPFAALAGGFVVGAVVWIDVAVTKFQDVFERFPARETVRHALRHSITRGLPNALQFQNSPHLGQLGGAILGLTVYAAVVIALGCFLIKRRYLLAIVCTPVLLWPFFVAASHLDSEIPRYAFMIFPSLAALLAAAVLRWVSTRVAGTAFILSTAVVFGWLQTWVVESPLPQTNTQMAEVADYLIPLGRTHIWATYWVSYSMSSAVDERVTAAPPFPSRFAPYALAAAQAPLGTVVTKAGNPSENALRGQGGTRVVINGLAIYLFDHPVPYSQLAGIGPD